MTDIANLMADARVLDWHKGIFSGTWSAGAGGWSYSAIPLGFGAGVALYIRPTPDGTLNLETYRPDGARLPDGACTYHHGAGDALRAAERHARGPRMRALTVTAAAPREPSRAAKARLRWQYRLRLALAARKRA